jgi:crotonobetainyl-CoA:carnitine CoA-transferase CaiB-like acyl-CoA transferase
MKNAFKGLKVIEVASVLAGPSVGLFFAEHGARVTKVENSLGGGDVTRSWKLSTEDTSSKISAYYASVNWGKDYKTLNLKDERDTELFYDMIRETDILIANFKHGSAEKLGLAYHQVKTLNPNLIYGEINGFGHESDRVAYDLILQAETGYMSMNGTNESGPIKMPVAFIDLLAGHQLKEGILMALYLKERKEAYAKHISVSLYDAAIASLANQATNWLMGNKIPERLGSLHPNIAPYGELFTCKDGTIITFAIGNERQFKTLLNCLHLNHLIDDDRFKSNRLRVKNRFELAHILQESVEKTIGKTLVKELIALLVPVAEIKNLKEVFSSNAAKELVVEGMIENEPFKAVRSSIFKVLDD